jgi:CRP-like cAMP-binding protein
LSHNVIALAGLMRNSSKTKQKLGRQAVRAHAIDKDYVKTTVPKSHAVRDLILKAMEANILFSGCSQEELVEIVDTFKKYECDKDHTVIKQGDDGDRFYVVESGELNIFIKFEGKGELEVGGSYSSGAAFGELALMYGSPRAATIRASEKCKLWALDRSDFRGVTGQHKLKRMEMQVNFLSNVKIGDQVLKDVMSPSNINDMVLATRDNNYTAGHVIVREGDKGDVLYLIESGSVDVFKKDTGEAPVATLSAGNFFGEKALLSEDVRTATCIAKTDVKCLELMREDLDTMVGPIQSLLDGSSKASSAGRISITGTPLEPPLGNHA